MMDMDEREVPLQLDFEDDGVEEDEPMADRGAFERQYADERSWEELQEDESGMLRVDVAQQQRQHRKRMSAMAGPRIQRGIIRYLFVLLDFSRLRRWIFVQVAWALWLIAWRLLSGNFSTRTH